MDPTAEPPAAMTATRGGDLTPCDADEAKRALGESRRPAEPARGCRSYAGGGLAAAPGAHQLAARRTDADREHVLLYGVRRREIAGRVASWQRRIAAGTDRRHPVSWSCVELLGARSTVRESERGR